MAGACWFLKRPQDGIRYLEKAIAYYERTDHKASAAEGYNNLGINLVLLGQWDRAQEALERALSIAGEANDGGNEVPMILDSLGELLMLRGELEEAHTLLERAVALATEKGNNWYQVPDSSHAGPLLRRNETGRSSAGSGKDRAHARRFDRRSSGDLRVTTAVGRSLADVRKDRRSQ